MRGREGAGQLASKGAKTLAAGFTLCFRRCVLQVCSDTMRRLLSTATVVAASQLLHAPGCLGLGRAAALTAPGASAASTSAGRRLWGRRLGGSPTATSIAGLGGMTAAEASFFTQHGEQGAGKDADTDLGDLRPGVAGRCV